MQVNNGVTVSIVDTQYGPCACSPLGKVVAISEPYAPNTTPVWTTYTYDSSGRALTVTAPDGGSVTRYTYRGNQTTVTDPAGKSKTFTTDAFGNLITVTETDPTQGTVTTNYTYNFLGQLVTVSMPRSNGTQTRTFQWTGADLTSAYNPENGTVTYTYDAAHRLRTRTDAKGQKTQYSYDAFGRKIAVQHFNSSGAEIMNQHVTYSYDYDSMGGYSQNVLGRLAAVSFANESLTPGSTEQFAYAYNYSQAGQLVGQRMHISGLPGGSGAVNLDAAYEWDNQGRMSSMTPPGDGTTAGVPNKYVYSYDGANRVTGMKENPCQTQAAGTCTTYSTTGPIVATATYGIAGEVLSLTYDDFSETRQYNSMYQLTRMTARSAGQTVMDMQYVFSHNQNNGRITQSSDLVSGETVVYTYDTLNRLAKAETTSAAWGEAYTYDGFGNLTAKTPTKGTAPSMTAMYDAWNHQVGQTYDLNGNTGANGAFPYDVENRLLQPLTGSSGVEWTYDPAGKRVFAKTPGNGTTATCEIYFYAMGQKWVTFQGSYNDQPGGSGQFTYSVKNRNLYFAGKLMRSAGVTVVTDRLGSVRANSNGERMNYFPYGEERTSTADGREKFGTYFRDPAANGGLDYADQRYYTNANGRFLNADPALNSNATVLPGNWNRYAYVGGDPVNKTDPLGLCSPDDNPPCYTVTTIGQMPGKTIGGSGGNDDMQVVNQNPDDSGTGGGGSNQNNPNNGRGPGPDDWGRAFNSLNVAALGVAGVMGLCPPCAPPPPDCLRDLGAMNVNQNQMVNAAMAAINNFQDGWGNGANYALSVWGNSAAFQANLAQFGATTIGQYFQQHAGTVAIGQALGNQIWADPTWINANGPYDNLALVMHELLHNITGQTDTVLQQDLNTVLPNGQQLVVGAASVNITNALKRDCWHQ